MDDALPTLDLLRRARAGDRGAIDIVLRRYLPRLRRFASGRLPRFARGILDTDDMIQDALLRTVERLDQFEPRGEGAFQAYVREALRHRITDEVRKAHRLPPMDELPEEHAAADLSPLEETLGRETVESYERALAALPDVDREAVIARVEMGMSYAEVAAATGKPTADAARMSVSRALLRVAEEMARG